MVKIPVAVAHGDGIGPEIMDVALTILKAAGCELEFHPVEIGEKVYHKGIATGIEPATWETIRRCKAFLKAPITTPQGGGFKSLNVATRTSLGLYANIRPCISYDPYIASKHPKMDLVIIRENEEDLYVGIEYRHSADCQYAMKMISHPGSEKIIRFAFEYAKANQRKKVTCFTKDNILKLTDGLFHKIFDEVALEYPDIENEHWIVDIGAAKLADTPEAFDVIVMPNLYGDILSDVGAQISGSVGLVGTANIGEFGAMFEAIHGSAPRRAGKDLANPSAMIKASILMLEYLDLRESASLIDNAWLKTIEDGIHTYDIFTEGMSKKKVGTAEFGKAVIERLGKKPTALKEAVIHKRFAPPIVPPFREKLIVRECVGVDLYLYAKATAQEMEKKLFQTDWGKFELRLISNRGATTYPNGQKETYGVDTWRVRFKMKEKDERFQLEHTIAILKLCKEHKYDVVKLDHLYNFDGSAGYSSANF